MVPIRRKRMKNNETPPSIEEQLRMIQTAREKAQFTPQHDRAAWQQLRNEQLFYRATGNRG